MNQEVSETVEDVHLIFKKRGLSLSVAESCTGGLISHYLTSLPGASEFFTAGIVSYSDNIKKRVLGVSHATIAHYGAVSDETAREMAERVRILSKTDYAVSTTGNMGPGGLESKAEGLVYVAAGRQGKIISKELRLKGNRTDNKEEAAVEALQLLLELVEGDE